VSSATISRGRADNSPSLLPGAATPSLWLALAILALSVLAGLELVAATAAARAAVAWSPRLAGSVTVAVAGDGLESTQAAVARATEILARSPGVTRIAVLDPDAGDRLAGQLMGAPRTGDETDPPGIIVTTFDASGAGSAARIAQDLRQGNVIAVVDDHGVWSGPVERTAAIAAAVTVASLLVLAVLTYVLAATAAAAAVRKRASRITLLLQLGATDAVILRPFRARAVGAAILGAVTGAAAAAALAAAVIWSPAVANWIGSRTGVPLGAAPGLDAWDLAAAAIWPPVAILLALWAASGAARARLRAIA
jgi:cell division protein FtsX